MRNWANYEFQDKKEVKEKEREKEIAEQEEKNLTGPRFIENEKIRAKLTELGLMIHDIPADGDCLYGAISHQLQLNGTEVRLNWIVLENLIIY